MQAREKLIIVHFGELWLRGRNRNTYIKALKRNIFRQLSGERFALEDRYDRLVIKPGKGSSFGSIELKISRTFGISAYETAYSTKPDMRHIVGTALAVMKESGITKVRINSHRSHKGFKFNSVDIVRKLCAEAQKIGIEPTLEGFDGQVHISVAKDAAYVFANRKRGPGGLPVGTSGRCVVLLSGGIDSPVAAWYAMKRGLEPVYVHVHGFSSAEEAKASKIGRIVGTLSGYWPGARIYYVPSHFFQMAAMRSGRYELVMMKGFMLRLAERIAAKEGAGAIVTGESLGQVASQTLPNIASEEDGIGMPVLRPLIGFDKEEITRMAESIGTYTDSIKPYKDVCSINSRNPVTGSDIRSFRRIAKEMGLVRVVGRSLKEASTEQAGPQHDEKYF